MPKFLGIDLGRRRIGVAVSDDDGKIALPGGVIEIPPCGNNENCARAAAKRIAAKARQVGAKNIVVGLPLLLSGESSPMTEFARQVGEISTVSGEICAQTSDQSSCQPSPCSPPNSLTMER